MSKKRVVEKTRWFTFLLYPDSLPEGWMEKLKDMDIAMAISPLHDMDIVDDWKEPSEDEMKGIADFMGIELEEYKAQKYAEKYKKPHFHVIYIAKNPVTANAVRNRLKKTLTNESVNMVQTVQNLRGMYKYLTHESEDAIRLKKHVYDKEEIIAINNFDIDRYVTMDVAEKKDATMTLVYFIIEKDLRNLKQLMQVVKDRPEEVPLSATAIFTVLQEQASLIRMTFDGVYQEWRERHIP